MLYPATVFSYLQITSETRASIKKTKIIRPGHVLVVVHAQDKYEFDMSRQAKTGIDYYIKRFKDQGNPVVFLVLTNDLGSEIHENDGWYTEGRKPDLKIPSEGGEYLAKTVSREFTLVGGYFAMYDPGTGCLTTALAHTIQNYFKISKQSGPLKINLPLYAIYHQKEEMGLAGVYLE